MGKVAVIGAGSWGTALSSVLAINGHQVFLLARDRRRIDEINHCRSNEKYLPDVRLPEGIVATDDVTVTEGVRAVFLVVPSQAVRAVSERLRPHLHPETLLVHAVKGFELPSRKRISVVLKEVLGEERPIGILSGPSHAEEVVRRLPTTVVVASEHVHLAEQVQELLMNEYFRVYVNRDPLGVELSGALKNGTIPDR